MKKFQRLTNTIRVLIVLQMLITLFAPVGVFANVHREIYPDVGTGEFQLPELDELAGVDDEVAVSQTEISAQAAISPTLEVNILGTPFVPYDSNDILSPEVFVVHAKVVNTGTVTAENVNMLLDFTDDQGTGWALTNGDSENRARPQLEPSNAFNAYWFATYPLQVGATHQYTVTLSADNFDPIIAVGTAEVVNGQDTGNNYVERSGLEVIVGVSFAITVTYNLGTNHDLASFNPAGNPDFLSGDYRLLRTMTDFFDDNQILVDTFYDQLYFLNLNPEYETATTLYEFIALSPSNTRLCPFTMVSKVPYKYDKDYCQGVNSLPITGTIGIEMDKIVSHETILQSETITYTINYTNNGALQLQYAWIWDDIDPSFASVLTDTLVPAGDPTWTNDHRAAWYPDVIGAVDDEPPPRNGTVSFAAVVDGGGNDLADGDVLVNHGKFGITEGRLPETVALTATTYTTIQAPALVLTKTDDQNTVEPGTTYTYTLQVENVGSEVAENLTVTDTIPAYLSLAGIPQPGGYSIVGDQIVWAGLGSLSFGDPPLELKIPVELDINAPDGHVITNTMHVGYANRVGHVYNPAVGTDTTLVNGTADFATIYGTVFHDGNGNGLLDASELGIVGVLITLDGLYTTTTDIYGAYTFSTTITGTHTVVETDPDGYFSTTPNEVHPTVELGEGYQVDFGDAIRGVDEFASIHGTVFHDLNLNGTWDDDEPGISGVTVTLDASVERSTDIYGSYTFSTTIVGTHTVVETDLPKHISTTPNTVDVPGVVMGEDYQVDFGDKYQKFIFYFPIINK